MPEYKIAIEFISDWHAGSGLGDGALADSALNRDANGMPWLTGRMLKGALREGAWRLALCREDLKSPVYYFWGGADKPGKIAVGPGNLPADVADWFLRQTPGERAIYVKDMIIIRQQTALEKDGTPKAHSLRATECGIPGLVFESRVAIDESAAPEAWFAAYLAAVCACVKSVGGDRARGLGNCRIRVAGQSGRISLPGPCPPEIAAQGGSR